MAIKKMYALLDHTSSIFLNPINFINDGDAIRWFTTVVNNKEEQTNINKYPEQYTLYRLSDWDDATGLNQPRENEKDLTSSAPKQLITGIQVQTEETKTYTVKQLITMLRANLGEENIVDIAKEA